MTKFTLLSFVALVCLIVAFTSVTAAYPPSVSHCESKSTAAASADPDIFPFVFKYSPLLRPLAPSFTFTVEELKDIVLANKYVGLGEMALPVELAQTGQKDMHVYILTIADGAGWSNHQDFPLLVQDNTILAQQLDIAWIFTQVAPESIKSVRLEIKLQIQALSETQTTLPFVLTFGEAGPEQSKIPATAPQFQPVNEEFTEWTVSYELPPETPDTSRNRLFKMEFTVGSEADIDYSLLFQAQPVGYPSGTDLFFALNESPQCDVVKKGETTPIKVPVDIFLNKLMTIKFSETASLEKNTTYVLQCPVQLKPNLPQQFAKPLRWTVIPALAPAWIELPQYKDFRSSAIQAEPMGVGPTEYPFTVEYTPFSSPNSPQVAFSFGNIAPLAKECSKLQTNPITVDFDASSPLNFAKLIVIDKDDKTIPTTAKLEVKKNADGTYTIASTEITGTALDTAKKIDFEFYFFSTNSLITSIRFPFELLCSESKKSYIPAQIPTFRTSDAELFGWSVAYAIPPTEQTTSQKRTFEMSFTTSDVVLNYPIRVKFSLLDNGQAGPFQPIEGKELTCLVTQQPESPALTIPVEIAADKKSFVLDFAGSKLPRNTSYKLHSCGIWLVPATAEQFTQKSRWTASSSTVPPFVPLSSTYEYKMTSIEVVAMNSITPGPQPDQKYNFYHKVNSAIAKYIDLVQIQLISVPSTSLKSEKFDFTFDLKGSARLRVGSGTFLAQTVCYNKDRKPVSRGELTLEFTINQEAVLAGKFVISNIEFSACTDTPTEISSLKESAATLTFPIDEVLTDKLEVDYFAVNIATNTRYTTQNIVTEALNRSLLKPGTTISMQNLPSKGEPVPKELHPYYATFTPITIEKTGVNLVGHSLILSSNATARTSLKPKSYFEYIKEGGNSDCDFGDFGKLTPTVDKSGTQLTFDLFSLDKSVVVDSSFAITCPNWFIHLTDTTRVSPISYSLVTSLAIPDLMSAEDEYDFFTNNDNLRDNKHAITTWVQPAIFSGPPTPDDDSTPEKKGHGAVIAIVVTLIIAVIAGVVFFLYKKGKFDRCFKRSREDNHLLSNDAYSNIE